MIGVRAVRWAVHHVALEIAVRRWVGGWEGNDVGGVHLVALQRAVEHPGGHQIAFHEPVAHIAQRQPVRVQSSAHCVTHVGRRGCRLTGGKRARGSAGGEATMWEVRKCYTLGPSRKWAGGR